MRAATLLVVLSLVAVTTAMEPARHLDRKTVAVLSFTNGSGDTQYDPLGKGIAAMMITDLSQVPELQLVERERLSDVTGELQLQQTKAVDPATAARLGKLVGAQYVVTGAINALDPRVRLDTRVIRVETGQIVKTAQVSGEQKQFFDLEQKLSHQLIKGLDVALSPEDSARLAQRQEQERIDDLTTQLHFSQALDLFDRKMYVEAAEKMAGVVKESPQSTLVRTTYKVMADRAKQDARHKAGSKLGGWLKSKIDH